VSASCDHVSLPRLDNLPLGEDRSPRETRELGEGRGEVDGAYHVINVNKLSLKQFVAMRTLVDLLVSNRVGGLPFRGIYGKNQRASA